MSRDEELLQVMFCCNGEGGYPTGFVKGIEIRTADGHELELEIPPLYTGPVFQRETRDGALLVRIGGQRFPISSYCYHVGNWCWDSTTMSRRTARECVTHALECGFQATFWTHDNGLLPEAHRG